MGNGEAEGEQKKNKEKKPKQKKGSLDTTSKTFFDGRHDTLISGISGFVSQTGHSEILTPVVHIIGKWVSQVANEWIYAENFIQQSNAWESKELFKYMKLATAACSFSATALHFGSELKMMTVLHELWDPTPDSSSNSSNGGWFGLRHLDSHVEVKDKRLSGKRMIKCIKKMQHATIALFQKLCKHGYAVHENEMLSNNENGEEDGDSHTEGAVCEYRSSGDVVYVIDKTSIVWPTYVKCIVVERIQINE